MSSDPSRDTIDGRIGRWTTLLLVVGTVVALAGVPALSAVTVGGPTAASDTQASASAPNVTAGNGTANGTATAGNDTASDTAPPVPFESVPADPAPVTRTQPDGTEIELRQWGSARQHGWETTGGYTVVQSNESGWWHYATAADGALAATDRRVGIDSPEGLDRGVRPTTEGPQRVASADSDTTTAPSLVSPADTTAGRTDVPIPFVLANFSDMKANYTADSFADLYFGSDPEEATGPGSFREYFLEASDGRVNFTAGPGVVGWVDTNMTHDAAGENRPDGDENYTAVREFAAEAIRTADDTTNFSAYDHDGDGDISVAVIHPGPGEEVSGDSTDIWSHRWGFMPSIQTDDGVNVTGYSIQPAANSDGEQNPIGVMAHETGHLIYDWPDLYEGETIDSLGLMGGGPYGEIHRDGDSPLHPIVWTKQQEGWTTTTRIAPSNQSGILPPASQVNGFYQMGRTDTTGTHYLLSYRALAGFDRALPSLGNDAGLYVWEVSNDGVETGSDIAHAHYDATGETVTHRACASCRDDLDLENVTATHDSIVFNDPPHRLLDANASAVYAVPVNTTLPDGRTISDEWRLSSRVSWANNSSDLDVTLTSPDGNRTLVSSATETSYEGVRTDATPDSGGWKLVESAGTGSADYYSATTYPTLPLPTNLSVAETFVDAGEVTDPDPVTANVTVRTAGQRYDTGSFGGLSDDDFTVTVGGDRVDERNLSVDRRGPGAYTLTVTPPAQATDGTYALAVNATDTKVGVTHVTNTSTVTVAYEAGNNSAPTAVASANRTTVTVDEAVAFDGGNSTDRDGVVTAYDWSFGDDATANGSVAAHTFTSVGTQTVELNVSDDDGATNATTLTVDVEPNEAPTAAVSANRTTVPVGHSVAFDGGNSTDDDGRVASYDWTFGGNATGSGVRPVHDFASAGTYTVELNVTDDDGATNATNLTVDVEPNEAPTAVVSTNRTNVTVDESVAFDGSNSTDGDGRVASYDWSVGTNTTANGSAVTHTFGSVGTYTVELNVTDDDGATNATNLTVDVEPNEEPTAAVSANRTTVPVGHSVAFDGGNSTDDDGRVASYDWSFGDNTTANGSQTTHAFASNGTYTVTLRTTDDDGATDNATLAIDVAEPNEPPVATVSANRTNVTVDEAVAFDGRNSTDADGRVASYAWAFGDNVTATGSQTAHTFAANGTYTVALTVTDDRGVTNTTTVAVDVATATGESTDDSDDGGGGTTGGGGGGGTTGGGGGGGTTGGGGGGGTTGGGGGGIAPTTDDDQSDEGDAGQKNETNVTETGQQNETNATDTDSVDNISVSVDDEAPTTGETVTVTVSAGDQYNGTESVVWTAGNQTLDRSAIEMGSDDSVTLSRSFSSPGEYQVTVANRTSATVSVDRPIASEPQRTGQSTERTPTDATEATQTASGTAAPASATATAETATATTTGGSGPGFGVIGAFVAVLIACWRRR